jgi:hydrogenase maturation protein HypF
LHPEYLASKYALESQITPKIGVQHHHAHIASVLAEHGLDGWVIGVAADGTGYGTDGAIWGGEIMLADLISFKRLIHLAYVPLPGGEQAIRQPWRMGVVYLQEAYGDEFLGLDIPFVKQLDKKKWSAISRMIRAGLNCPMTSSLGRLFDAVAALVGLRCEVQYEGQAAIELEAQTTFSEIGYGFEIGEEVLDVRPMIHGIVGDLTNGDSIPKIAGRFHRTIAEMLFASCQLARQRTAVNDVALSGGVFQNKLLLEQLLFMLEADGFRIYINRQVPPNDGGLSFGQAAIAAARLAVPSNQSQSGYFAVQDSNVVTMKRS